MRVRILEESINGQNMLCPYVVCGHCNDVIRPGQFAHVLRPLSQTVGDVEDVVFHDDCPWPEPKGLDRSLGDWLTQLKNNSVGFL